VTVAEPETQAEPGRPGSAVARLRHVATGRPAVVTFLAVALGFGCYAVASDWSAIRAGLDRLTAPELAAGLGCVLLALLAGLMQWRAVLADLGSRLPLRAAARVFFLGQLGKYLPGSVWAALGQIELATSYRVPRRRSAATYAITMLTTLIAAVVVAAVLLPFVKHGKLHAYIWVLLVAPLGLVALLPPVLRPLLAAVFKLLRQPPPEHPVTAKGTVLAFAWAVVGWLGYGLQIWVLTSALGAPSGRAFAASVGGFALAWSVGFLVLFAPAGAGAREATLVVLLTPVLSADTALLAALVSRLLMTAADLLTAACAVAVTRNRAAR
jgi:glycosyltransferase 2 family protein